jgi:hypothetical protein
MRVAVENLQIAMQDYKSLMTESTQQRVDTVVKFGAIIAEVCRIIPWPSISYVLQMDPFAKLAFGLAKGTFDVSFLPWPSFVIRDLHISGRQLLKEQRRYDENVSELASGIDGLLPFAEQSLEGVLYEEGLLDGVVRRLYDLIGDAASFIVGYVKRGPASM